MREREYEELGGGYERDDSRERAEGIFTPMQATLGVSRLRVYLDEATEKKYIDYSAAITLGLVEYDHNDGGYYQISDETLDSIKARYGNTLEIVIEVWKKNEEDIFGEYSDHQYENDINDMLDDYNNIYKDDEYYKKL